MRYRYLDLSKIVEHNEASLIMRLMMAYNDISSGRVIRTELDKCIDSEKQEILKGINWYTLRMSLGHVHEAIEVLSSAKNSNYIGSIIKNDGGISETVEALLQLHKDSGDGYIDFIGQIRNKAAFHYDKSWWKNSLSTLVKNGTKFSTVAIPEDLSLPLRWTLGDTVTQNIFQTHIFRTYQNSKNEEHARQLITQISYFVRDLIVDTLSVLEFILGHVMEDFQIQGR